MAECFSTAVFKLVQQITL